MGESEGHFVLFLGGKSLGKSHMLRELAARLPAQGRRVLVVNARSSGPDLVGGLISSVKGDRGFLDALMSSLTELARVAVAAAANAHGLGSGPAVSAALIPLPADTASMLPDLLHGFVATCKSRGEFPVLIIDEANSALPSASSSAAPGEAAQAKSPQDKAMEARTLAALKLLTQLTKECREMNVLLASSEHAEPFRLASLGFKTEDFTETVVACEVPPPDMRALLVDKWRCGPQLAEGLMAVYGGHVWRTSLALGDLAREGPAFEAIGAFSSAPLDGVNKCLAAARGGSGVAKVEGLEDVLRELAERGFAAIPSRDDPRAEVVSENNVGGVVPRGASAPGLPRAAWATGAKFVLAASSQSMRLLLASELAPDPLPSAARAAAP